QAVFADQPLLFEQKVSVAVNEHGTFGRGPAPDAVVQFLDGFGTWRLDATLDARQDRRHDHERHALTDGPPNAAPQPFADVAGVLGPQAVDALEHDEHVGPVQDGHVLDPPFPGLPAGSGQRTEYLLARNAFVDDQ